MSGQAQIKHVPVKVVEGIFPLVGNDGVDVRTEHLRHKVAVLGEHSPGTTKVGRTAKTVRSEDCLSADSR